MRFCPFECMNEGRNESKKEGRKELDTYLPPNIRLINSISKWFTINRRFASVELPTWVGRAEPGSNVEINCLFPL